MRLIIRLLRRNIHQGNNTYYINTPDVISVFRLDSDFYITDYSNYSKDFSKTAKLSDFKYCFIMDYAKYILHIEKNCYNNEEFSDVWITAEPVGSCDVYYGLSKRGLFEYLYLFIIKFFFKYKNTPHITLILPIVIYYLLGSVGILIKGELKWKKSI